MAHIEYDLPILAASGAALVGCTLCWGLGYGNISILLCTAALSAGAGWMAMQVGIGLLTLFQQSKQILTKLDHTIDTTHQKIQAFGNTLTLVEHVLSNAEESFTATNTEIQKNLRELPDLIAHLNRTLDVVDTTLQRTQEEMGAVGATFGAPAHFVRWTGNLFKRKTAANESADNDDPEAEEDENPYDDILVKI